MHLGKAMLVLAVSWGILFVVKQILLLFRGGQRRG